MSTVLSLRIAALAALILLCSAIQSPSLHSAEQRGMQAPGTSPAAEVVASATPENPAAPAASASPYTAPHGPLDTSLAIAASGRAEDTAGSAAAGVPAAPMASASPPSHSAAQRHAALGQGSALAHGGFQGGGKAPDMHSASPSIPDASAADHLQPYSSSASGGSPPDTASSPAADGHDGKHGVAVAGGAAPTDRAQPLPLGSTALPVFSSPPPAAATPPPHGATGSGAPTTSNGGAVPPPRAQNPGTPASGPGPVSNSPPASDPTPASVLPVTDVAQETGDGLDPFVGGDGPPHIDDWASPPPWVGGTAGGDSVPAANCQDSGTCAAQPPTASHAVPEPGSLALGGLGLLSLVWARRRHQAAARA